MEVNVSMPSAQVGYLCCQGCAVTFGRVPFAAERATRAAAEWYLNSVVRISVVLRRAKEAPDHRPINSGYNCWRGMNVSGSQIVVDVRGLGTGNVDVVDGGRKGH